MDPLHLSPLPVHRATEESGSLLFEREGFVDESVVAALRTRHLSCGRQIANPQDLALAADDLDFAGWMLAPSLPQRAIESQKLKTLPTRRATPPELVEYGIGQPHSGKHRWWLAGLAGIFSTLLFSVLLLNLANRKSAHFGTLSAPLKAVVSASLPEAQTNSKLPDAETTAAFRKFR